MPRNPERLASLPTRALDRMWRRHLNIIDRLGRERGGHDYGWDWPTLALVYPHQYRSARRVAAELNRRTAHRA